MTHATLTALLRRWFPLWTEDQMFSVQFVSLAPSENPTAVMRIVIWHEHEGEIAIRDVKDQFVPVRTLLSTSEQRAGHLLEAMNVVMTELSPVKLDHLMPGNILDFSVLRVQSAVTAAHFAALLRKKGRWGAFVG